MNICGVSDIPDFLKSLGHFQNTEEQGKEAYMSSCFIKQDFPPDAQTRIQSPRGAENA